MKRRVNVKAFAGLFACILIIVAALRMCGKDPADKPDKENDVTTTTAQTFIETAGTGTQTDSSFGSLEKNEPAVSTDAQGASYVKNILIVNKTYSLPDSYNPGALDSKVQSAFDEMDSDAKKKNLKLVIASGYRSYEEQELLYNKYVDNDGQEEADTYSARPGHSEHQTGLCFDLSPVEDSFADTEEGKWVAENCWKYGFIIRYPKGKEAVTGYKYEPWHLRYVGKDIAKDIYDSNITLEEYLGVTSQYNDAAASLSDSGAGLSTEVPSESGDSEYNDDSDYGNSSLSDDSDSQSYNDSSDESSDNNGSYETGIKFY